MSEGPECVRVPFHDAVLRCCAGGTYVERGGRLVSYLPERRSVSGSTAGACKWKRVRRGRRVGDCHPVRRRDALLRCAGLLQSLGKVSVSEGGLVAS